jgi:ABC-type amino acid transport substrate-binding protein
VFCEPYLISGQSLAVDVNRLPDVRSVDDLSGLTIGVQQGNTSRPIAERLKKSIPLSQKMAGPPEKVAAVVEAALTARQPRARYVVGAGPKLQLAVMSSLPTSMRDRVLRAVAKQPS